MSALTKSMHPDEKYKAGKLGAQLAKVGVALAVVFRGISLVLTLAAELKDSGVTANIIQVRAIDVGKKGTGTTPDVIVAAIQYLFSEQAGKVSGARIPLY